MGKSAIEWTEFTWNPVTGCTKVSPGCKHCYAETFAERWRGTPGHPYEQGFDLRVWPNRIDLPLHWRKPRTVFVNSMSDLFHEEIAESVIHAVFQTMNAAPRHRFQVLTKRSARLASMAGSLVWPSNVWMGVSVESGGYVDRIHDLRKTPAAVKFLSLEPLLGPLPALDLTDIDWVIVGGESGQHARPMDSAWVIDLRDQCRRAGVPFFFKQWGGPNKKAAGRILEGRTWSEMPDDSAPDGTDVHAS